MLKSRLFFAVAAVALAGAGSAHAGSLVTVMTRNLYLGTDLTPVIAATNVPSFLTAVKAAYTEAQASNFAGRMGRVADEIAVVRPDLVGLQEAVQWRTGPPDFLPTPDATTDAGNFVQLLLTALAARGLDYTVASESTGYDVEAPGGTPPAFADLMDYRLTQHEVILARVERGMKLSNPNGDQYPAFAQIPVVGGTVDLRWAWASVDVTKDGRTFRFATTHLDSNFGSLQRLQAQEFLGDVRAGNTSLPLVWVGDFNSAAASTGATGVPPDTETHSDITAAGFTDAWAATRPGDPGFTCCNAENLLNPTPTYTDRIDYVFTRGAVAPLLAARVGVLPLERLPTGQWPSDHAGVVAALDVG
jgi:endonuclease/exonuclease/phosphatase family metal-dependent hydrolase